MSGKKNRVNGSIDRLSTELRDQVNIMLADVTYTYTDISEFLKDKGYEISRSAVGRYYIRMNKEAKRYAAILSEAKAISAVTSSMDEVEYNKVSRIMLMRNLTQRVSTSADEIAEMPLDKAGRLIASLGRVGLREDKQKKDYKRKMELAFLHLEDELMKLVKGNPELAKKLSEVMKEAKGMLPDD